MDTTMILSMPALVAGFKNSNDKKNVGIHEFAHLIDKADGFIDGIPVNLEVKARDRWIELFYKEFTDPIEFRLDPSSNADARRYFYQNALSAKTLGFEIELRKGLEFISPALKPFSLFGNYTYLRSEVVFNDLAADNKTVKANRPLQGQSPYLLNAGLQYTTDMFSASVLYNRVGERLTLVGNEEFPNVYERPRNQLDIQLSKKVIDGKCEIRINFQDILKNAFYFYENVNESTAFDKGVDRLFNSYKQGSTITVGFTYDFNIGKKK
jgi:outer membrane receptor protein involved in Fe transport